MKPKFVSSHLSLAQSAGSHRASESFIFHLKIPVTKKTMLKTKTSLLGRLCPLLLSALLVFAAQSPVSAQPDPANSPDVAGESDFDSSDESTSPESGATPVPTRQPEKPTMEPETETFPYELSPQMVAGRVWNANPAMTGGKWIKPASASSTITVKANQWVTLQIGGATDKDTYTNANGTAGHPQNDRVFGRWRSSRQGGGDAGEFDNSVTQSLYQKWKGDKPGTYLITATLWDEDNVPAGEGGTRNDDDITLPTLTVVVQEEIASISVTHGASTLNMRQNWPDSGNQNWGCLKIANNNVIVRVETRPHTKATWDKIQWNGGYAVAGKPNNYRRYPRDYPARFNVKPLLNGTGPRQLQIWVMWAEVSIKASDKTPANAVQFGTKYDGTEDLGGKTYNGGDYAVGKVVPIAQLYPADVHNVAGIWGSGWNIKRRRVSHDYQNGAKVTGMLGNSTPIFTSAWVNDTSYDEYKNLTPDSADRIYDRDAPSVGPYGGANRYVTHNNFQQWVTWNDKQASSMSETSAHWLWQGIYDQSKNPKIDRKRVEASNQMTPLPTWK